MMKHLLLKITILFLSVIIFTNCNNEPLENDSNIKVFQEDGLNTVPLENSLEFFTTLNSKKTNKNLNKNDIDLNIDLGSLRQVDITNTNAKLNIANATTKFDNVETQILQIEINGELQTVLFHKIPDKDNIGKGNTNKSLEASFTGSVFSTNLSGTILSGFSVNDGNILDSFNFFSSTYSSNPDPCWGITCGILLDEVIITTNNNTPSSTSWAYNSLGNTSNIAYYYQWGRSLNNYTSMGVAYANYYRSLEVEKWDNIIIQDSGPKIDPVKETQCFDHKIGGKLTIYVQQPNENSLDLIGENQVGHVFVSIEQNGKRRVFGFYPPPTASNAGIAVGNNYVSELRENSGELYHVSISTNINATQMDNIINYVQNFPKTYNLSNYACTDFGIAIGNLGGLNLPNTTVSGGWGIFSGRSPAKLGQEIRSMNSTSERTIIKTKGKAPSKTNETC